MNTVMWPECHLKNCQSTLFECNSIIVKLFFKEKIDISTKIDCKY